MPHAAVAPSPSTTPRWRAQHRARVRRVGARAAPTPIDVVTVDEYAEKLKPLAQSAALVGAFYDSRVNVIARGALQACAIPLLDRGFHRGHGVFDACAIRGGGAHALRAHVERLVSSAREARIDFIRDADEVEAIVMATIRASGVRDGQVRMYVTSGVARSFALTDMGDTASFYVACYAKAPDVDGDARAMRDGWRAVSSPIPIKPPKYARLKSTNYMPNVHCAMDASERGADVGCFLTTDGFIGEGPGANVAFLTPDGTLRTPPATEVLGGITIRRIKELIEMPANAKALRKVGVKKFDDSQPLSAFVVIGAEEAMLIGSACDVKPIVQWDGKLIGDGTVGAATKLLAELLAHDMLHGDSRVDVDAI